MLDRLVETFCEVDDFCKAFMPQWDPYLLGTGTALCGPEPGLFASEIITILLMLHSSRCKHLKNFYQGYGLCPAPVFPAHALLRTLRDHPKKRVQAVAVLSAQSPGTKGPAFYYIDSTVLPNVIQYPKI